MVRRRAGVVVSFVVALAACSGGSESAPDESVVVETTSAQESSTSAAAPTTTTEVVADGPLADVCDDTLVVQATDLPDVGTGPLYALLGPEPAVDPERQVVSAPLTRADGTVEDVTLEIRSGGPAVGFRSPVALMAEDESIHLAVVSTADAIRDRSVLATQAVMAMTDRSSDAVIVDPATYPDVDDVAALAASGVEVRHVTDAPVIAYLAATGALMPDQLVGGSDGLPASFVEADGTVAQQGDLTIEPALLASLPQWGRPVAALPAADAGWASLDDMVVADAGVDRLSDECLGRFVRILQQSVTSYVADPAAANATMGALRAQFNPLERLTPGLLDIGTQLAVDAGVFDTSIDRPAGAIVTKDWDPFLAELSEALDVETVTADQLVDLRFLDPTISR